MPVHHTPAHVHEALVREVGPLPVPANHETFSAYLDRRATACLEIAERVANLAETVGKDGHTAAFAELVVEARDFLAEYDFIDSMRIRKP
ncbi:hypothetical protein ABH933_001229 [Nocardia sp. GP40]|uniref:hypothetical protein n=1 Tax=Nocardia sp. GP40 TaxID=3156268 RepID=UPI003D1EEC5C